MRSVIYFTEHYFLYHFSDSLLLVYMCANMSKTHSNTKFTLWHSSQTALHYMSNPTVTYVIELIAISMSLCRCFFSFHFSVFFTHLPQSSYLILKLTGMVYLLREGEKTFYRWDASLTADTWATDYHLTGRWLWGTQPGLSDRKNPLLIFKDGQAKTANNQICPQCSNLQHLHFRKSTKYFPSTTPEGSILQCMDVILCRIESSAGRQLKETVCI